MFGAGTKADTGVGGRITGPHVGAILSQTRQSLGQSITDVARDLRIRRAFLEAIEGARYADLPGPAYTLGFIRTYAEHLGLEGDEIVRRFKAESGQVAPKSKLNFPSPMTESTAPKAAVLLIGAVIALVAYGIWYLSSNRYLDVAELVLPLPEHLRKILPGDERGVDVPDRTAHGTTGHRCPVYCRCTTCVRRQRNTACGRRDVIVNAIAIAERGEYGRGSAAASHHSRIVSTGAPRHGGEGRPQATSPRGSSSRPTPIPGWKCAAVPRVPPCCRG